MTFSCVAEKISGYTWGKTFHNDIASDSRTLILATLPLQNMSSLCHELWFARHPIDKSNYQLDVEATVMSFDSGLIIRGSHINQTNKNFVAANRSTLGITPIADYWKHLERELPWIFDNWDILIDTQTNGHSATLDAESARGIMIVTFSVWLEYLKSIVRSKRY